MIQPHSSPPRTSGGQGVCGRLVACLLPSLVGVLLAAPLACAATAQTLGADDIDETRVWSQQDLDVLVAPLIDEDWMMGLVIGIIDGERTETYAYGRRSEADDRPLDDQSLFEIGSVTKLFTGLLLADAVRQGEVTLDMPVAALLPERAVVGLRETEEPITLLDLSTHSSGLSRLPLNMQPADWRDPYQDYSVEDLYAGLASITLSHKPKTPYAYSNLGVGLLGHVLAIAGGKNWESLVQRRICKPLHLGNTRIQLDDERHERFVQGHDADLTPAPPWDMGVLQGAGGLRSSVADMLAFGRAHLARPEATEAAGVGQSAGIAMVPRRRTDSDGYMVGLGWHIIMDEGVWLHTGQTGGYSASISVLPEREQVVVLLTNTATGLVAGLAQRVRALIGGAPVSMMALPPTYDVPDDTLEEYVGVYSGYGVEVEISRTERGLWGHFTEPEPLRIYPVDEDVFLYRMVRATLTFERDESGQPTFVVLNQNGRDIRMLRVETTDAR